MIARLLQRTNRADAAPRVIVGPVLALSGMADCFSFMAAWPRLWPDSKRRLQAARDRRRPAARPPPKEAGDEATHQASKRARIPSALLPLLPAETAAPDLGAGAALIPHGNGPISGGQKAPSVAAGSLCSTALNTAARLPATTAKTNRAIGNRKEPYPFGYFAF